MGYGQCIGCGRIGELAHSIALGGECCEDCHCKAARPVKIDPLPRIKRPRYVPTRYEDYVNRVCGRIAALTGQEPVYLDARSVACFCPACLGGTLHVRFNERPAAESVEPKPEMIVSSQVNGTGYCSDGCSEADIGDALFS